MSTVGDPQGSLHPAGAAVAEDGDEAGHLRLLRTLADMTLARPSCSADHAAAMLALLLFCVLQKSAWPVAIALIGVFGSFNGVLAARRAQLAAVAGMTEEAVNLIQTAHAALRWAAEEEIRARDLLASGEDVRRYLRTTMRGGTSEVVHGLFLDRKNHLIHDLVLAVGTVDHVPLHPREVVRHAIELDACALILYHNHPSGDPEPSLADIESTRNVARALAAVHVVLHDHFIVGGEAIVSLRARGCF